MSDMGIFICPACEAVIEGDNPCPNGPHGGESATPTEHEVWLHDVALRALMQRDESLVERDKAVALLRDIRPVLAQMKDDIAAVLTVYDEHVAPENRGPWRDRLAALIARCAPGE